MSILVNEPTAENVSFDANNLWVTLADGRKLGVPLAYFPRLLHATPQQRRQYVISGGGTGLHWEDIDENISVKSLILGIGDMTKPKKVRQSRGRKISARQ